MGLFIVVICILVLIYSYIGWRIIIPSGIGTTKKRILWFILILFMVLPLSQPVLRHYSIDHSDIMEWAGFLSVGYFQIVFTFLLLLDIAFLLSACLKRITSLLYLRRERSSGHDPERRRFISYSMNMGVLAFSGSLTGYGFYEAQKIPGVVEISIPVADLPPDLEGFRIVQISDIHIGSTIKRDYLESVVDKVNALDADIVAITGDLADGPVSKLRHDTAPLSTITSRYGSYFVTGNHEYYSGVDEWVKEVKSLGIDVLMNEHRLIRQGKGSIIVAGVTDYRADRFSTSQRSSPSKALSGAPHADLKILLAHQPRSVYAASEAGFDLQISGHTHGGQFFPWNFLISLGQPYVKGLHKYENTQIYVNKGTGYWGPPIRLGADSEITLLKLTNSHNTSAASS